MRRSLAQKWSLRRTESFVRSVVDGSGPGDDAEEASSPTDRPRPLASSGRSDASWSTCADLLRRTTCRSRLSERHSMRSSTRGARQARQPRLGITGDSGARYMSWRAAWLVPGREVTWRGSRAGGPTGTSVERGRHSLGLPGPRLWQVFVSHPPTQRLKCEGGPETHKSPRGVWEPQGVSVEGSRTSEWKGRGGTQTPKEKGEG